MNIYLGFDGSRIYLNIVYFLELSKEFKIILEFWNINWYEEISWVLIRVGDLLGLSLFDVYNLDVCWFFFYIDDIRNYLKMLFLILKWFG